MSLGKSLFGRDRRASLNAPLSLLALAAAGLMSLAIARAALADETQVKIQGCGAALSPQAAPLRH